MTKNNFLVSKLIFMGRRNLKKMFNNTFISENIYKKNKLNKKNTFFKIW